MSFQVPIEMVPAINKIITSAENNIRQLVGRDIELQIVLPYSEQGDMLLRRLVCEAFGVTWEELSRPGRKTAFVQARHVYSYLADSLIGKTLVSIAEATGRADHSTVIHAIEGIERAIEEKKPVAGVIDTIVKNFRKQNQS